MIEDKKTNLPPEIESSYRSHEETALRCAEEKEKKRDVVEK
jgi:hypothetical protein